MDELLKVLPFGAILGTIGGIVKWYLGFRIKLKSIDIKNLDILEKLKYDSDEAKINFSRSYIFSVLTRRITCIHHINLMFNSYDPRRLLMIYSKAPGFIAFSDKSVIKPKKLANPWSITTLFILLSLIILSPVIFLIANHFWPTQMDSEYYELLWFLFMFLFTFYGIRETIFLIEVLRYYKDKNIYGSQLIN